MRSYTNSVQGSENRDPYLDTTVQCTLRSASDEARALFTDKRTAGGTSASQRSFWEVSELAAKSDPASSSDASPSTCDEQQNLSPEFWQNDFVPIVSEILGGITQDECKGPWETDGQEGNEQLANKVKVSRPPQM